MFAKFASLAVVGVAALSGVARAQECQTAIEVIAEVVGPNFAELLGKVSAEEGAALLGAVATADSVLDEPVTLFIPTDKAFGDANAADLPNDQLLAVLLTHAVPGTISTQQLKDGAMGDSVGGSTLMGVDQGPDGSVKVVGSASPMGMVVDADIPACSGPIHVIDAVLLPADIAGEAPIEAPMMAPAPAPMMMPMMAPMEAGTRALPGGGMAEGPAMGPMMPCMNVVDALSQSDNQVLGQLAAAYLSADTIALLSDPMQNLTVFAPPEEDLLALLGGIQNNLVPLETAQTLLLAHVVLEFLPSEELLMLDMETLPTAAGADVQLDVFVENGMITLTANNSVQVVTPDIDGCSDAAIIHGVSEVIVPEGVEIDLSSYPPGDVTQLEGAALAPGGAPGTRGLGGVAPEAAPDSAAGVFRGLLSVGAAAVALAVAL